MEPLRELGRRARGQVSFVERFVPDAELASAHPAGRRRRPPVPRDRPVGRALFGAGLRQADRDERRRRLRGGGAGHRRGPRWCRPRTPTRWRPPCASCSPTPTRASRAGRAAARAAAEGPYSWDEVGRLTLDLYSELTAMKVRLPLQSTSARPSGRSRHLVRPRLRGGRPWWSRRQPASDAPTRSALDLAAERRWAGARDRGRGSTRLAARGRPGGLLPVPATDPGAADLGPGRSAA